MLCYGDQADAAEVRHSMAKWPALISPMVAILGSVNLQAGDSCSLAKAKLEEYLVQLPHACKESTDCDGYFYRADACAAAVVLAKPGVPKPSEPRLLTLQGNARGVCPAEFSTQPACSPIPYRPVCRNSRCVDALSAAAAPALPPHEAAPHHFPYATVVRTCAPWDGPAVAIRLSDTAGCTSTTGPYIQISLWRDLPVQAGQTIRFDLRNSNGQASRCPRPNQCEAAISGSVLFDIVDEGKKASGRYELRFAHGSIESGSFDADWCETRALCG
jgi:hypothetical protein